MLGPVPLKNGICFHLLAAIYFPVFQSSSFSYNICNSIDVKFAFASTCTCLYLARGLADYISMHINPSTDSAYRTCGTVL